MLKKLWRWFYGEPEPDTVLEMMRVIVQNQEKSQVAMMSAVQSTIDAGARQAEVLASYLKLFQSPGDPQSWKESTPEDESVTDMKSKGFDASWPEDKQAEWVLAHIGEI